MQGEVNVSKINVGILFGGKSVEHEVSLQSARNIIEAMDKEKYNITLIGISKQGEWFLKELPGVLNGESDLQQLLSADMDHKVTVASGNGGGCFLPLTDRGSKRSVDVIFPVLHGTYGEDGTVQGLLKLAGIPFVGPGVLGSAVGMDKDVAKRLLRDAQIPVSKFVVYHRYERDKIEFNHIAGQLGLPLFIKPANSGSSVGVAKVKNQEEFVAAVNKAFDYDRKILIEECITGREIECSVLGNEKPLASAVGEIIAQDDFYSYDAKYLDEKGAILKIPANISADMVAKVQAVAVKTFRVLCCEGMARVDMFLTTDNRILVNEINTIPGFTKISMYPKLWEVSGLSYRDLIDKLLQLALERHNQETQLSTSYLSAE
jgi:D-alanine-D-alanine ligase